MPNASIPRSKPSRTSIASVKARLNQEKQHCTTVQHQKKTKNRVPSVEVVSDDEESGIADVPKRKATALTPVEYLLAACTFVGIQSVYRESMSVCVGQWSARHYFKESTNRVENRANELGIEPVLHSSTATICSKSMKKADYITCDVNEADDWNKVESVVFHLAKSLSKGIRVDLVIKYNAKRTAKDIDDIEVADVEDSDETDAPKAKHSRKVVCAHIEY